MTEDREQFKIRVNEDDRPFLDAEALRLMKERFEEERELERPSYADVISALLEELRDRRERASDCSCGARCAGKVQVR